MLGPPRVLALADDAARVLVAQGQRNGVGVRPQLLDRLLVGEGACAPQRVEAQRSVVGRGRLTKGEELDEEKDDARN
jgi:hypothetical protein